MNSTENLQSTRTLAFLIDRVKHKQREVDQWLASQEGSNELPLYSSVDIRDGGFKAAVVDTNIFPAGFNNLCEHGLEVAVQLIRQAIERRVPACREILIVAEEHTRNMWYLENIRILQQITERAGFNARIATFLTIQPAFCQDAAKYVELQTATGYPVKMYCFRRILSEVEAGREQFDLIIMNNDLTTGIPEVLKHSKIPIYPSVHAGWHSRHKSSHFRYTHELMVEFARILELDPWFFSCIFSAVDGVNINIDGDRAKLSDAAADLFKKIEDKYKEHQISEKPYLVLKSDSGTYGMGVLPIEDPSDILHLNRRDRNRLYKGKSAQVIDRYILQEGVPTIYHIDREVSEVVLYQIENKFVGGFYRSHMSKGSRENLNTQGMVFKKMCPRANQYPNCGAHFDPHVFGVYRILARIAGIAAHREILQLEADRS